MRKIIRSFMCMFSLYMIICQFTVIAYANGSTPFLDIGKDDWYYESVEYVNINGLMTGMQSDMFGPTIDMSRAMVVTVLWRMEGQPQTDIDANFQDVPTNEWYAEAVHWANKYGIVTGYENGMFGPSDNITREQMATMLYRYAKYSELNITAKANLDAYHDANSVSGFAVEPMQWAVGVGLMKGLDENTLGPAGNASRAQVATLLMRFCTSELLNEVSVETNTNYAICDIEKKDSHLNVTVSTIHSSQLSVEILDENETDIFYQDTVTLKKNLQLKNIALYIPDDIRLPDYYIIKAKLMDSEGNLLCSPFVCRDYTKAYELFINKKETDYPMERVIEFGEENDENFAVLHEDVIRIEESESMNQIIINSDASYQFKNPDSILKNLKSGDKLYICDEDGNAHLIKIDRISVLIRGDVLIYEDSDTYLADFYDTIKINTALIGLIEAPIGRMSSKEYLSDIEMGPAISNSIETDFGSFSHSTSIGGKLEINYDFELFGEDYLEFILMTGLKSELGFDIGANKNVSDELEIVSIPLVGIKNIAEIPAEISLAYEIDSKAGANTTFTMEAVSGCIYNSYDGSQTVEYKELTTGETKVFGEISASMGPRLSINAELLDEAIKASLGAEGGVALNGKAVAFTAPLPDTDSYHACDLCVDGTLQGYFELEMKADYNIHEKLQGSIIDFDLLKATWNMGRFYCSLINEVDSVHKGNVVFDFGNCPNSKYRTILHTYKNNEELTGCSVYVKNTSGTPVDFGSSIYQTYVYPGRYSAEAFIDGREGVKSFTVSDKPVSVDIVVKDYYLNGFVTDDTTKQPLSGVSVMIKKDGNMITSSVTDANGYYEVLLLENGSYDVHFSKSGYNDASSIVQFVDNQTASLNVSLKPASFKVKFKVTCWGQTVAGATIEGTGHPQGLITGSDGTVTVELPPGRYLLIARGKGYYGNATITVNKDMNVTIDMFLLDHL